MSKLIYCSYSLMDADARPDWVGKLFENPVCQRERWAFWDPSLGFAGNVEDPYVAAALSDPTRLRSRVKEHAVALRLDPMLLQPLQEVVARLRHADGGPSLDVAFKSAYALARSDLVLADLNAPSHGETSQEVMYAYLFGVPVVGIAHRFILSPWVVGKVKSVIFPSNSDDIVHQILANDTANAAYVASMRAAQAAVDQQGSQPQPTPQDRPRVVRKRAQRTGAPVGASLKDRLRSRTDTSASATEEPDGDDPGAGSV